VDIDETICFYENERVYEDAIPNQTNIDKISYDEELQNYYHSFYTSDKNPFCDFYKGQFSSINYKLPHSSWKQQFYNHFAQNIDITDICKEYLKSLLWTYKYYTQSGIPSWNFHYKYRTAPLSSDLYKYIKDNQTCISDIVFDKDKEIAPLQQLLIVTPIQHSNILPWSFQQVYKEDEWESVKFKLDILKGLKNIYSDPILPDINLEYIDKFMANIPVTEIEKTRNLIRNNVFCMKF
jgi:5'-3' exonuclease